MDLERLRRLRKISQQYNRGSIVEREGVRDAI
jgi:hypothetical protein